MIALRRATDPTWLPLAVQRFDEVLVDHAHCEKKAAANALSLLQHYPEVPRLPQQMAGLAREEASHLARVLSLMERRGLVLGRDPGDPYVQKLQASVRTAREERRVDRLLVAALVEARSCERLSLLAAGLAEPALRDFYGELAQSERGHQELFVRLAEAASSARAVAERLPALLDAEQAALDSVGLRAAVH